MLRAIYTCRVKNFLLTSFWTGNFFYWGALFLLGFTGFVLAYRHSLFFGWTHPKGGEVEIISILVLTFTLMLVASFGSTKHFLGSLALVLGTALGFISPWASIGSPYWYQDKLPLAEQIWDVKRVAHAGGVFEGLAYSNTIDALEENKAYFDYFEIDLSVTTDGQLVCLHNWGEPVHERIFGEVISEPVTLSHFQTLNNKGQLTACEVSSLKEWLLNNPRKYIITDIKSAENLKYLSILLDDMGSTGGRVIPQVYRAEDIEPARTLGYRNVILTAYRMSDKQLAEELRTLKPESLFAITVPLERVARHMEQLLDLGTPIYAHTVNDLSAFSFLRALGVSNVYTDTLIDTSDGY